MTIRSLSTRSAAADGRSADQIDHLWVVYHDFAGIGRAKSVTGERIDQVLAEGLTFARANWDFTLADQQVPDPGYAADSGDLRVVPDRATLRPVPHLPGVVQSFADLLYEGQPWQGDPRGRLKALVAEVGARGYTMRMAFESEFSVLRGGDDGRLEPVERHPMFALDSLESQWAPWGERVITHLGAIGVPVHQFGPEFGKGQFEISLLPADPVSACDYFLLTRQVVKAAVAAAGGVATFMPKPFTGSPGNGLHVHLSLVHPDRGEALSHPDDPSALSSLGQSVVAALLKHARGQSALGSATPNSYKRLLRGSWAPTDVTWALGNRSALVRIPGPGPARRIEYRSADASSNVYLHALGLLAAVLDGLDHERPAPAPATVDVGRLGDETTRQMGMERLPVSLVEALAALVADSVLSEAVGEVILPHYVAVKEFEHASYVGAVGDAGIEVTDWERETYLTAV